MKFVKENPVAALVIFVVLVVLVGWLIGPIIGIIKFALIVIGGITVAKWVLEALSD